MEYYLDTKGFECPIPVLKAAKFINFCAPGKNGISEEQRTKRSGWAKIDSWIWRLASASMPNGFSPRRCFPAAKISG